MSPLESWTKSIRNSSVSNQNDKLLTPISLIWKHWKGLVLSFNKSPFIWRHDLGLWEPVDEGAGKEAFARISNQHQLNNVERAPSLFREAQISTRSISSLWGLERHQDYDRWMPAPASASFCWEIISRCAGDATVTLFHRTITAATLCAESRPRITSPISLQANHIPLGNPLEQLIFPQICNFGCKILRHLQKRERYHYIRWNYDYFNLPAKPLFQVLFFLERGTR